MFFNRSYNYNDVLTRASITLQVIEDVAIYKAQLFSSNGNIFSSRDESSDLHVRVFKGFEDITDRFTDIIWKRFTADSGSVEEDAKWGEQHKGKKDIVITKEDIQSKANIQVEVYGLIQGKRSLVATDFITFIDVNDMEGSPTPPSNPKDGDLWLDTSVMPPRLMVWDSSLGMWVEVTVAGNDRRNLIRHSNFYKKNFDLWTAVNVPTLTVESLSGKKWARIKSTSVKNAYCGISQITNATAKAQYSFQMLSEVYIQSAYPNGNAVAAFYSINESNVKTLIKEEKFDLTTDEKVFTTTFTSLVDTKKIEVVISGQKDAQFDFVVTNIKLENHPIPTAWELAIEDMQDALDQKVGNTSEEVFDSLTDNGKMQGLYVDIDEHGNKNFYFKGQFIDAKNLRVMNNNGTRTLYINENGNIEIVASSFTLVAGADTNVPTKDEVKEQIDNIQFAAGNFVLHSDFIKKENTYTSDGAIDVSNGIATIKNATQFKMNLSSSFGALKRGDDIVLSSLATLTSASGNVGLNKFIGGNIDVYSEDHAYITSSISKLKVNMITVPVVVAITNATSADPTIPDWALNRTKAYLSNLKTAGLLTEKTRLIFEPHPLIAEGTVSETIYNPTDKTLFFTKWKEVIVSALTALKDYKFFGIYIGTNFEKFDTGADNIAKWENLIIELKKLYNNHKLIYRTNWWTTASWAADLTAAYEAKVNNPLWGKVDIISIAAYFELNGKDVPTVDELYKDITEGTSYNNRGQNIFKEVKKFYDVWKKPVMFGELGCPSKVKGASAPWDNLTANANNEVVQANLFEAYNKAFIYKNDTYPNDWFLGYSIFTLGTSTSEYNVVDKQAQAIINKGVDFINNNASGYVNCQINNKSTNTTILNFDLPLSPMLNSVTSVTNKLLFDAATDSELIFNLPSNSVFSLSKPMLSNGTKAASWVICTDDLKSNINDVENTLNDFQNTVNGAFKDDVINEAEAKAIKQNIVTLDNDKADTDKDYVALYNNPKLTGTAKSNLSTAKTDFDLANTSTRSFILTAIADNKITPEERASVDSSFVTYRTKLGIYRQRSQEAVDAIGNYKVDNIQIGGRNLLYKTNETLRVVGANRENQVVSIGSIKGNVLAGKQVTFQFKYKVITETISGTYRPQTGMSSWIPLSGKFETLKKEGEYFYYTNTIPAADKGFTNVEIRFENMQGEIEIYDRKLELGNKPSDWSEAQEDVNAEIDKAKADAATANQNATNAQTSANQANDKVNEMSNDNKLTSIEKQSAKLEWDVIAVEKPKIEAEAVKFGVDKTDYVAKYNTLANYLSPLLANLSVTSDIVGDTFRTNFKNYYDSRQTLLNAISSKAKDIADKANDKIDNLQIGGTNIVSVIRDVIRNASTGPFDQENQTWTLTIEDGAGSSWGAGLRINTNKVIIPYGASYVMSFEVKVPVACEWNVDVNTYPVEGTAWSGNDNDYTNLRQTSSKTLEPNKWIKCWFTIVNKHPLNTGLKDLYDNSAFGVRNSTGSPMTYQIKNIKGELGTIPTAWSPCMYDVDKAIADANQKAQEALNNLTDLANDNKLTPNEKQQTKKDWDIILGEYPKIISEANKSGVSTTNYTNAYNVLKNYIEPILSNLNATTDITGVAFRNNFKSYYDNRQDVLNAISTALKANADNANNKIDGLEIGTTNIIRNSRNPKSLEFWPYCPSPTNVELIDSEYFGTTEKFFSITNTTTIERYLGTQRYKLEGGKTYSFSMIVNIESNVTSIDVWFLMKIVNSTATDYDVAKQFVVGYNKVRNKFHKITGTLTIPDNIAEGYIRIDNNGGAATANRVWFSAVKLEQGTKPSDWSAAPEDTQSDIDNKVDVGGSIDDINQSPNGQIDFPKLNIKGAISFDALDSEMSKNFIAKKDSQGNRIQTVINGGAIETSSVTADKMSMYNLNVIRRELVNGVWQERDTSFAITDEGKIRASGTFSSFNYRDDIDISKSEGWMINENGDSVFNSSIVRGRVELPNAGITDYGGGTVYNLLQDSDFRIYTTKTDIGWDNSKNGTNWPTYWGGYNSGVGDPSHGYHARIDVTTFPFNTFLFRNKNSEIGQTNRWMGISQGLGTVMKANAKYTFAVDIYFTAVGQKVYGGLYHKLTDNATNNFNSGQYTFISTAEHVNKWTRLSWTFTTNAKLSEPSSSNWYIYGYGGTEGDVFINKPKLEAGEVPTPYASTADVAKKEVRIYSGAGYYDRYNAPFRVLQDGSVIATKGEFSGTVTGRLEIGNISIYDDLTTPGVIEIKNNDNSKTVVKIGEEYSEFNSDVYIGAKTDYLFRTNISGKQLVSGKQSSIRFEYEENNSGDILSNSMTLNGKRIQFNENEYISSTTPGVITIGTEASKGTLDIRSTHDSNVDGVFGEMHVNVVGTASLSNALKIGNVDFMPIYPEGLDIFVN